MTAAHASRGKGAADWFAALQLVVSCFPQIDTGGVAMATRGELELLLKLFRRQLRLNGDDSHEVHEMTALVTQLAIAVVNYCGAQLQPKVRYVRALLLSVGSCMWYAT